MKLFGFNITRNKMESETFQTFNTPFQNVGDANLSLPVIKSYVKNQYVPFGNNNDFPQLLNQLYYTSPLHGAIVDFKTNATIGGGYEIDKKALDTKGELEFKMFERRVKLSKFIKTTLQDLILHDRVYIVGTKTKEGAKYKYKICPSKVRTNRDKSVYYLSSDWTIHENVRIIKRYKDAEINEEFLWCYENNSIGQDIYPIPAYSRANNWAFLDGEMSYLQKSNILNSIFPSFIMTFPRKPQSEEEKQEIKDTIGGLKGASNAGKSAAFFGVGKENLPEIVAMPTNQNDSLFYQTTESIDSKICQAHIIDPILMGIRVSGKLGSGSDIKQSYVIFEKNTIMPLRAELEEVVNSVFNMFGYNVKMTINDYQIVNETIVEIEGEEGNKAQEALNLMSPLVATKVLESMTPNEIRSLAGLGSVEGGDVSKIEAPLQQISEKELSINDNLKGLNAQDNMDIIRIVRDFKKGKLTEVIARTRLASYGFDNDTITQILSE